MTWWSPFHIANYVGESEDVTNALRNPSSPAHKSEELEKKHLLENPKTMKRMSPKKPCKRLVLNIMGTPGKFEVWIIRAKCAHSLCCVQNASSKKYYMPGFLTTFQERGSEFDEIHNAQCSRHMNLPSSTPFLHPSVGLQENDKQ